jgi:hypothetical protein
MHEHAAGIKELSPECSLPRVDDDLRGPSSRRIITTGAASTKHISVMTMAVNILSWLAPEDFGLGPDDRHTLARQANLERHFWAADSEQ